MGWILKGVLGVLIVIAGSSVDVLAIDASSRWTATPPHLLTHKESTQSKLVDFPCGGDVTMIRIAHEPQLQQACVFGESGSFRMAKYRNNQGLVRLLASYPLDVQFYIVENVCIGSAPCVYSQSSDTLLVSTLMAGHASKLYAYPQMSTQLRRTFCTAIAVTCFKVAVEAEPYLEIDGLEPSLGEIAVSHNGKWAVVQYLGLGIVHVDMKNGVQRRIAAMPYSSTGYRLAVSDDGTAIVSVATAPYSIAILTEVDATCGDRLTPQSTSQLSPYARSCAQHTFSASHIPRYFSTEAVYFLDNNQLHMTVSTRDGFYDTIYTPASYVATTKVSLVSLGDSFTSGEGEDNDEQYLSGTKQSPHTCHVSARSYPYRITSFPYIPFSGATALNAACSGAVMEDIIGGAEYAGQGGRLGSVSSAQKDQLRIKALENKQQGIVPQLEFLRKYQPDMVTVGIGGNDAGFMGKLKSCLGLSVCQWAQPGVVRGAVAREIDALYEKYSMLIQRVKQTVPQASVTMISYPQIISDVKSAPCGVVLGPLLSDDERIFITKSITRINEVMRSAAKESNIQYISIEDAYEGHKLCQSSTTPAMNGLRSGDDIAPLGIVSGLKLIGSESFHPTHHGHSFAATHIARAVGLSAFRLGYGPDGGPDDSYWEEGVGSDYEPVRYVQLTPDIESVWSGDTVVQTVPPGMFADRSEIVARFQDDTAEYRYSVSSGAPFTIKIPPPQKSGSGVITVELKGETPSGEHIIAYRMIALQRRAAERRAEQGLLGAPPKEGRIDTATRAAPSVAPVTMPSGVASIQKAVEWGGKKGSEGVQVRREDASGRTAQNLFWYIVCGGGVLAAIGIGWAYRARTGLVRGK